MTDRDHFSAAALTGLLARRDCYDHEVAVLAWDMADAMLRERCRGGGDCPGSDNAPNLDAAPVPEHEWKSAYENMQRASLRLYAKIRDIADDVCGIGSGVTVSTHHAPEWLDAIASEYHRVRIELEQLRAKTNHDAAPAARASEATASPEMVCVRSDAGTGDTPVTEPMTQEKQAEVSDRSKPITGPDPDSRVWGTHTHAAHATQGEGSEPRDGTQEPVAWGVANGSRVLATSISRMDAVDMQGDYAYRTDIVPLYRSPTLTDAEAETLRELRDEAAQYADEIGLCASEVRGRQRIIDGLLARLGGER